ncbi:unnamed protein product [Urochloa decumbens]|uniref:DUF4220 domain-containing protein n=1 Tax=Urochloa decumbens TaxID=240449 RepID=A0ABC9E205_9POAL
MLGLTSTMRWWEEWQLRILVLGSLLIQFILAFGGTLRRSRKTRWIIWLAYTGGDTLAIYALATLFTRQKLHRTAEEAKVNALEVVWAPVLLIHLGGHSNISAFSLEDNELWPRHIMTLMTQVAVAIYVFCKWWSGDWELLVASSLLFVLGIIKSALRPWALRSASFDSLQGLLSYRSVSPRREKGTAAAWWTWCTSQFLEHNEELKNRRRGLEKCGSLADYVQKASEAVLDTGTAADNQEEEGWDLMYNYYSSAIGHTNYFVDVIAPYSARLTELQSLMMKPISEQFQYMNRYVQAKTSIMYSNSRTLGSPLGIFLHLIVFPCLGISSAVLFFCSRKDGYSVDDIRVTYVLFCCTAALDCSLYFLWIGFLFHNPLGRYIFSCTGWLLQYNLLSYYGRKKKPTFLMKLAYFNSLKELINKSWYVKQVQSISYITTAVFQYVVIYGWKNYIKGDATRYKRFNNLRGQGALNVYGQMKEMGWSLSTRFDESVILWHIATDLCFHLPNESPQRVATDHMIQTTQLSEEAIRVTRHISNYMIYLLVTQPELLIPGTRPALFAIASDDIELILGNTSKEALDGEENIARAIMNATRSEGSAIINATTTEGTETESEATEAEAIEIEETEAEGTESEAIEIEETEAKGTLVHQTCKLAEALLKLDENIRWNLIQWVWMEMLCYSVSRRRGYLQAKSIGEGTDNLVHVWVLWALMGMETWVERYHRFEHSEEDGGAAAGGVGAAAAVRGGEEAYCVGVSSSSGSHTSSWEADQSERITAV